MDSIVSPIVTPIVESLLVPIKKHLGYLISTTKHVAHMHTKMGELNDTKSDVKVLQETKESNSLRVPARVLGWLDEVEKINAQVKSIYSTNVGSCFNLKDRHKLGRKACNIIPEINRLMVEKSNIDWTDIPIPPAQVNSTSKILSDYADFKSREKTYLKALSALKPDSTPHMIALCGMGGVGKTKMTEKLKNIVSEKAMFDFIVEVAIGVKMDVSVIQKAVGEQLAIELKESTKEARVGKLHNAFKKKSDDGKKKFLVILDDLWQTIDLKDIGLSPKPDQGIDFKVLLTSRDRNVCIQMGVELDLILNLEIIEDSEAQDFFLQFAKISDDIDLRKIGRDITIRCHGLPIAIKTIALTLKGQIKDVWEDTLFKLEHKGVHEVAGEIFAISYKHLCDEETRLTLLLCGLFPEDFDIPKEDLVRYAYGLKSFTDVNTIRETRSRLNTCVERLIHANLLIRSQEVRYVKMHDLVRDFVLDVSSKGEHSTIVGNMSKWPDKPRSEFCKKISLTCIGMHDFPTSPKHPNLSLLKLMHGDELLRFSEKFYKEMKNLEVIAYNNIKYPLNLRSLQCSSNLRTLCLHQCSLMSDCSSIGNLSNLEVLSFARSSILKLPSTIVNLKKLKLLDLTDCWYICIDNGILKSLVNLKELYMTGIFRKVNVEDDEWVACVENLDALEIEFYGNNVFPQNMSFKNLKRFRISLGCSLHTIDDIRTYSFENTLRLFTNEYEQLLDSEMNELLEKTKVLYLGGNGINDLVDRLGAPLQNLRVLQINECTNLKYVFTVGVANGLKQLERLTIDECSVLETLVDSHEIFEAKVITFAALKFLSLKNLPMLMSLCKGGNVIELPQLEELVLQTLPNFTSIYQLFLKKEVMNTKLKKLKIYNLEKLKEILPSQLSNNDQEVIGQLKEIIVRSCYSLVNLLPSNPMSLLHHLEELFIEGCGSIDVIFNIDLGSSCLGEINEGNSSSNLRSVVVQNCSELREVWRVKGVNNDLPILGFQAVEYIKIQDCKRLRNVFTPTTSNFDMKALTKIVLNGRVMEEETESDDSQIDMTSNSLMSPSIPRSYEVAECSQVKEINDIFNEDISEVVDDFLNVVAFPSYLMHTCNNVHTLDISRFKRMEVVFEIGSPNNQQPPLLKHLKDLDVFGMERMTHVWKYDWNQLLTSQQEPIYSSFPNLTSIRLENCHCIKYLFSPLMAKLLSNLKSITIYDCYAIEEVVSNIDDEYDKIVSSISSHTNNPFFQHVDFLDLYGLESLKCIDGFVANRLNSANATPTHDKFQGSQLGATYLSFWRYLKKIHIRNCNALRNLIPSHAIGQLPKVEEIEIKSCNLMREIFEIEGVDEDVIGDDTDIGKGNGDMSLAMTKIQRLTNMTSLELPNLKKLHIEDCRGLRYIFTSSTLDSLKKLQDLKIKDCSEIQVIVKQEDNGLIASKDVVFHRLKSLTLVCLPNLKGFFLGENKFRWPSLDEVEIYGCPQMMIFTSGVSEALKLKYIHTGVGKHSLECGLNFDWTSAPYENPSYDSSKGFKDIVEDLQFPWSFSNLIEVDLGFPVKMRQIETIFPSNKLVKEQNLGEHGDVEEAVKDKVFEGTDDKTQSIDGDDVIPNSKKKQLLMSMDPQTSSRTWKNDWWTCTHLSNLTKLSLKGLGFVEYVFSYDMAATLIQLQDLHIRFCDKLKVIVEQVEDSKTKAKEVFSFPRLKSLQFTYLPNLEGFCLGSDHAFEWPSLHTLEITECRKMKVFTNGQSTTPKLKVIKTRIGLCEATEDLNSFVRTKLPECDL